MRTAGGAYEEKSPWRCVAVIPNTGSPINLPAATKRGVADVAFNASGAEIERLLMMRGKDSYVISVPMIFFLGSASSVSDAP